MKTRRFCPLDAYSGPLCPEYSVSFFILWILSKINYNVLFKTIFFSQSKLLFIILLLLLKFERHS